MRKSVLFIAVSLDGYIADKAGSVEWLSGDGSDSDSENMGSYSEFMSGVDTVILGYSTYNQIVTELSPDVWAYKGMKSYVITHRDIKSTDEIIFTAKSPTEIVKELKSLPGKDIFICGGAKIANDLVLNDMIDRYHISVMPVVLGGGTRLFEGDYSSIDLKLVKTDNYNGIVDLVYERR